MVLHELSDEVQTFFSLLALISAIVEEQTMWKWVGHLDCQRFCSHSRQHHLICLIKQPCHFVPCCNCWFCLYFNKPCDLACQRSILWKVILFFPLKYFFYLWGSQWRHINLNIINGKCLSFRHQDSPEIKGSFCSLPWRIYLVDEYRQVITSLAIRPW